MLPIKLNNVQIVGQTYYPGIKFLCHEDGRIYAPIQDKISSIPDLLLKNVDLIPNVAIKYVEHNPVFFFVYNVDNYYHFVFDTLPYLIDYLPFRDEAKLLVNSASGKLHKFVIEFLDLLGIKESDLIFARDDVLYENVLLPRTQNLEEKHSLYRHLIDRVPARNDLPKKIYVSRRSQKHGNYDNIGTNYTSKRKLANEDELVAFLQEEGYTEIFTELLDTQTKIALFKDCTHVVGAIGGGLCNVLFSKPSTKLISIVSPFFLEINSEFHNSLCNVDLTYFRRTDHVEYGVFKKYMRVRVHDSDIIGEIQSICGCWLNIAYSDDIIAGWNAQTQYKEMSVHYEDVDIIDNGLNSEWIMDMEKFKCLIKSAS